MKNFLPGKKFCFECISACARTYARTRTHTRTYTIYWYSLHLINFWKRYSIERRSINVFRIEWNEYCQTRHACHCDI